MREISLFTRFPHLSSVSWESLGPFEYKWRAAGDEAGVEAVIAGLSRQTAGSKSVAHQ